MCWSAAEAALPPSTGEGLRKILSHFECSHVAVSIQLFWMFLGEQRVQ